MIAAAGNKLDRPTTELSVRRHRTRVPVLCRCPQWYLVNPSEVAPFYRAPKSKPPKVKNGPFKFPYALPITLSNRNCGLFHQPQAAHSWEQNLAIRCGHSGADRVHILPTDPIYPKRIPRLGCLRVGARVAVEFLRYCRFANRIRILFHREALRYRSAPFILRVRLAFKPTPFPGGAIILGRDKASPVLFLGDLILPFFGDQIWAFGAGAKPVGWSEGEELQSATGQ